MNPQKRNKRLNELLKRLKNNAEVSNRDLKLVLTEAEYAEMQVNWQIEKSHRKPIKPKEIKRYELMLKRATLAITKNESYKGSKVIEKKMADHAEHLLEQAKEYALEIGGKNGRFSEWFGGFVNEEVELDLSTMPRIRTSKSYWNDVGKNELSIRNIKILAVEQALNKHNVNQELVEATEAIKLFKAKRNFKEIKF
jgi:hypothetical protein